jgi:hypothetical protein
MDSWYLSSSSLENLLFLAIGMLRDVAIVVYLLYCTGIACAGSKIMMSPIVYRVISEPTEEKQGNRRRTVKAINLSPARPKHEP